MNAITLHVESLDPTVKAHREEVAGLVVNYFEQHFPMPKCISTLCYLDCEDLWLLKEYWGRANRGIHWPILGQGLHDWPGKMWNIIAQVDPNSGEVSWPYASLIYLHDSTCTTDVGLTLTLAHEIQHFLQFANDQCLWVMNTLLANLPGLPRDGLRAWSDFPAEREARIIAKRIAENFYGKVAILEHIQYMIAARITDADAEDWQFIESIDSSVQFNLAEETKALFRKHQIELIELYNDPKFRRANRLPDIDLSSID
jgi:hypothetical protein